MFGEKILVAMAKFYKTWVKDNCNYISSLK